jgi:hypothetical protein
MGREALDQRGEVVAVKFHSNGSAISFQWRSKPLSVRASSARFWKSLGSSTLRWTIEK